MVKISKNDKQNINSGFSFTLIMGIIMSVVSIAGVVGQVVTSVKQNEMLKSLPSAESPTLINSNFSVKSFCKYY